MSTVFPSVPKQSGQLTQPHPETLDQRLAGSRSGSIRKSTAKPSLPFRQPPVIRAAGERNVAQWSITSSAGRKQRRPQATLWRNSLATGEMSKIFERLSCEGQVANQTFSWNGDSTTGIQVGTTRIHAGVSEMGAERARRRA